MDLDKVNMGFRELPTSDTESTLLSFLEKSPPFAINMGRQISAFCGLSPLLKWGIRQAIKNPAPFRFPPLNHLSRVAAIALVSSFIPTGLKALKGYGTHPLYDKLHQLMPETENSLSNKFLQGGLIGWGYEVKNKYSQGRVIVWGLDVLYSFAFLTAMNMAIGTPLNGTFFSGVLLVAAVSSISSAYITQTWGNNPAKANLFRQGLYLTMNAISTISDQTVKGHFLFPWLSKAVPIQMLLAGGIFLGLLAMENIK